MDRRARHHSGGRDRGRRHHELEQRQAPGVHGRKVQVDPIKAMLKAPGSERLILKHDQLVSNFAFHSNLRRYIMEPSPGYHGLRFWDTFGPTGILGCNVAFIMRCRLEGLRDMGRGLHSLTSELHLRTFGTHRSR